MTLVAGATGLLGFEICSRLRRRGNRVRALVRQGAPKEAALHGLACEIVYGDLKDGASVESACRNVSTVVTTVNAILSRRNGDSLRAVDRDGHLSLLAAAKAAGVRHFIYTSLSPTAPANNPFVGYKREIERAVRAGGMDWTILQPAPFMEIHAGRPLGWDFVKGRARIMGSGRAQMSYVSVNDVAEFAAQSVENPTATKRDLHISGPEPLTPLDAVRIAERVTGLRFKVQRVPTLLLRVLGPALRPVAPIPSSLIAMAVAMESGPEPPATAGLLQEFSIRLTTFEEYVRQQRTL